MYVSIRVKWFRPTFSLRLIRKTEQYLFTIGLRAHTDLRGFQTQCLLSLALLWVKASGKGKKINQCLPYLPYVKVQHDFNLQKNIPFHNSTVGEICVQLVSRCQGWFYFFFPYKNSFCLTPVYYTQRVLFW